jgi:thiol-disulfide isomerase/thioredoxin
MRSFETQLDFEQYWFGRAEPVKPAGCRVEDKAFLMYFTASWCGPCKRLDMDSIEAATKALGIPIWKVEQTVNENTAAWCDVRSLPTFMLCKPKEIVSRLSSSSTLDVVTWLKSLSLACPKPLSKVTVSEAEATY